MTLIPNLTFTDYEWFPWSIYNGCGMPAGNAYPSGHQVPSPILGIASALIVETKFLELAMSLLDFSPWIPLGTFSILLCMDVMIFCKIWQICIVWHTWGYDVMMMTIMMNIWITISAIRVHMHFILLFTSFLWMNQDKCKLILFGNYNVSLGYGRILLKSQDKIRVCVIYMYRTRIISYREKSILTDIDRIIN